MFIKKVLFDVEVTQKRKNCGCKRINTLSKDSSVLPKTDEISFVGRNSNKETIDWYDKNAEMYFNETNIVSMEEEYPPFLKHLPSGGEILDAGCGSGRDSKAFSQMKYKVTAFDASEQLAKLASINTGLKVINTTFADFKSAKKFDGIWAWASLLHVPKDEFEQSLMNLINHLKGGGVLFASMKEECLEEKDFKGRGFNYVNFEELKSIFARNKDIELIDHLTLSEFRDSVKESFYKTRCNKLLDKLVMPLFAFRPNDHPFMTFALKKINPLL
ncbi:MAG: class I SAM-dependent methyltransferase [Candidatus Gastranaerophilaceae bacterium]